jgi:hypothetical protein
VGVLQADGYAGFNKLYEKGRILEAACWAHVRRKFHDLYQAHRSPIAKEALERIGQLYAIEQEIRERSPAERKEVRQARSRPLLESMQAWWKATLAKLSQKSDVAMAIRYALDRWSALLRFCEDGRVEMDNNAAERALRAVALGRKNYLFCRIGLRRRARGCDLQPTGVGQAERDRSRGVPQFGAATHCRSPYQPDCRTAAVESVSGHGGAGGLTLPPSQRNRAHNFRIVGTISNDTQGLDWEQIESKLLAAAAYVAPRRILYLRFHSGELYRYFTFPAVQYQEFLEAESKGRYFLSHIRNRLPYQKLPR